MRLRTVPLASWPPLAWLATCVPGSDEITVVTGRDVEAGDDWVCEGVWDASFSDGDFDCTDLVFGSGLRVRGDEVVFVSSGTTLDRLHALDRSDRVHVSNSLPAVLSVANGSLDPRYTGYRKIGRSIMHGLDRYEREVPTTVGTIRLTYFNNLGWDGRSLCERPKPEIRRALGSYRGYRSFLDEALRRIADNAAATERARPLQLISTISSGYDSPTVTVLARGVGCQETFGFDRVRGDQDDSGAPIAEVLGIRYHALQTAAWRSEPMAAVPFLAALAAGGSGVLYKGAESLVDGKVVLTGYNGDKVWGTKPTDPGDEFVRLDTAGVDLTEYRLWAGFVHCPVPFFGVRQIRDVQAIGTSDELAPWNVTSDYNRPICRRIVEEEGVPRKMFGVRKKATAQPVLRAAAYLTRDMRRDYYRWVRAHRGTWRHLAPNRPSVLADMRFVGRARAAALVERARLHGASKRSARGSTSSSRASRTRLAPSPAQTHHQFIYHWAVDREGTLCRTACAELTNRSRHVVRRELWCWTVEARSA